jgi:hypothetical protein
MEAFAPEAVPLAGDETAFERAREIYARLGAQARCRFIFCQRGHRFYANEAWTAFDEVMGPRSRADALCPGLA